MEEKLEEIVQTGGVFNRFKRGITYALMIAVGYLGIGCGDNDSGGGTPPDETGPDITNVVANNSYEGNDTVSADVTDTNNDTSNVASVVFQYRANGSSDTWTDVPMTNTSGNTWSADVNFSSDEFEYRVTATDAAPLANASQSAGTVRKHADEAKEDVELDPKLASYSEVLDYGVNDPNGIDIGGTFIYPDYWALIENPSFPGDPAYGSFVVGWYQGPGDDDHAAEKALCESYFVPWAQINACPQDEIGTKLDEIRAAGWVSGQIKAKTLEKQVEEVQEEIF
jgi:hypothetical protein